jgi:hypothetical protein
LVREGRGVTVGFAVGGDAGFEAADDGGRVGRLGRVGMVSPPVTEATRTLMSLFMTAVAAGST